MYTALRGTAPGRLAVASIRPATTAGALVARPPLPYCSDSSRRELTGTQPTSKRWLSRDHHLELSGGRPKLAERSRPGLSRTQIPQGAKTLKFTAENGEYMELSWTNEGIFIENTDTGRVQKRTPLQLRDGCSCALCRDGSSGQKSFATTELPFDMQITNVKDTESGGLIVTVNKDIERLGGSIGHDIHISPGMVATFNSVKHVPRGLKSQLLNRFPKVFWDKNTIEKEVRKIDYEEFMQEDSTAFWDVIQDLVRLGLVFLKNVPKDEGSIVNITTRIANIRETFYGRTFDVRAKPNAENIAYTSGYLGLHQDLLYLEPPHIQILHCMENSCEGGESLFSDADRVGHMLTMLMEEFPFLHSLASIKVPYGYNKDGHRYWKQRPMLNVKREREREHELGGEYTNVYWSPPFQSQFTRPVNMYRWASGARVFESAVNDAKSVYQTRLQPGECALFDNLRVLHGRNAFEADGGSRWLRGAYIAFDDFLSTALHAPDTHGVPEHAEKRFGDGGKAERHLMSTPLCREMRQQLLEARTQLSSHYGRTVKYA